jgi:hypothetical protein
MNPAEPLINWLSYAVTEYLNGADAQLVMAIAQTKADAYTACLAPQIGQFTASRCNHRSPTGRPRPVAKALVNEFLHKSRPRALIYTGT